MEGFLFLLMIAVLVALTIVIYASRRNAQETNRAWSEAAKTLGIQYTAAGMLSQRRMDGILPTGRIIIETFQGSHENSETYTRYRALYPAPLGLKLRLAPEGFRSGLGKLSDAQDIQVGDPAFDERVIVKGMDPVEIKRFLTPDRRRHILKAFAAFPGLTLDDREVRWEYRGLHKDPEQIVSTALRLSQLAWRLSRGKEEVESTAEPMGSQVEKTDEAAEALPATEPPPLPISEETPQAEEKESVPEPVSAPEPPLDVASVCNALFPPGTSSIEASRILEERYQGKRVEWSGVLKGVESYSFDWIFGDAPGTKATIELYEMPSEVYGYNKIHAALQLGAGEERALREHLGKTVSFQGTLWRADGLMRIVYCKDGSLRPENPERSAGAE